ncbi:MAG: C39 family peptidase [Patescibacteria group bacterium]
MFAIVTAIILATGVIIFLEGRETEKISTLEEEQNQSAETSELQESAEMVPSISDKGDALDPDEKKVAESFSNAALPMTWLIKVPFLSQAPSANWDALHEDACEEASLIMVRHFLDNKSTISRADGDEEIKKMVAYEERAGYGGSITLRELSIAADDYFSISGSRIVYDFTVDDLKKEIAAGRPVIIPASGKALPNPNFRNGGPKYHMLVIVGYDEDEFITNDPGTKNGEGYLYKYEDLFDAIHDWDPQNINNGQKAFLVFD